MSEQERPVRLTVQLDDRRLYRALRHLAVEQDRSLRDIVAEALRDWVVRQENLEDLAAIHEGRDEPTVPWEQVKAEIREAEGTESAA